MSKATDAVKNMLEPKRAQVQPTDSVATKAGDKVKWSDETNGGRSGVAIQNFGGHVLIAENSPSAAKPAVIVSDDDLEIIK